MTGLDLRRHVAGFYSVVDMPAGKNFRVTVTLSYQGWEEMVTARVEHGLEAGLADIEKGDFTEVTSTDESHRYKCCGLAQTCASRAPVRSRQLRCKTLNAGPPFLTDAVPVLVTSG